MKRIITFFWSLMMVLTMFAQSEVTFDIQIDEDGIATVTPSDLTVSYGITAYNAEILSYLTMLPHETNDEIFSSLAMMAPGFVINQLGELYEGVAEFSIANFAEMVPVATQGQFTVLAATCSMEVDDWGETISMTGTTSSATYTFPTIELSEFAASVSLSDTTISIVPNDDTESYTVVMIDKSQYDSYAEYSLSFIMQNLAETFVTGAQEFNYATSEQLGFYGVAGDYVILVAAGYYDADTWMSVITSEVLVHPIQLDANGVRVASGDQEPEPGLQFDGVATTSLDNAVVTSLADLEGLQITLVGALSVTIDDEECSGFIAQNEQGDEMYAVWSPLYGGTYTIEGNVATLSGWYTDAEGGTSPVPADMNTLYLEDYGTFIVDGEEVYCNTIELTYRAGSTPDPEPEPIMTIESGKYYIVTYTEDTIVVATELAAGKTYGYLPVIEWTGYAEDMTAAEEYTFEAVAGEEAHFYIKDAAGHYLYQTGNYNSFNLTTDTTTAGVKWLVSLGANNLATIKNLSVEKVMQFDPAYNTYGSYAEVSHVLPLLVPVPVKPLLNTTFTSNALDLVHLAEGSSGSLTDVINIADSTYAAVKIGKSKNSGAMNVTLPTGTTQLSFHALAWNRNTTTVNVSLNGDSIDTFEATGAGISGNSPYTYVDSIGGTPAGHYYVYTFDALLDTMVISFASVGERVVFYGINILPVPAIAEEDTTVTVECDPLPEVLSVAQAIDNFDKGCLTTDDSINVRGIITKISMKPKNFLNYGSVCIYVQDETDDTKIFEFYNCYSMDAAKFETVEPLYDDPTSTTWFEPTKALDATGKFVQVGDAVTATGKILKYNTTYELNTNCYLIDIPAGNIPSGVEHIECNGYLKLMENGVLYIIRDGVRYTVAGQVVR